jgi:peptide/nickel transport system substrate-binding protein
VREQQPDNQSIFKKIAAFFAVWKNRIILPYKKTAKAKETEGEKADKKLIFSLKDSKLPNWNQLKYLGQFLSRREKKMIQICSAIIAVNLILLGIFFYHNNIELKPASGGNYTEIITGSPKFINPLYASINNVDSDLVALIYSGLLKRNKDNSLVPDLAEKFSVSDDGKTYTFYLKKELAWHDKSALTADDIIFTFQAIANPEYKSPLRTSFTGVEVEKIDDSTVKFSLTEPYSGFLELLTTGIMPVNTWSQITPAAANLADLNLKPIGSGPYKFKSLAKDKTGNIRSYELEINKNYFGQKPYINNLIFKFYSSFEESAAALNEGKAEGLGYLPKEYETKITGKGELNNYYLEQPQSTILFFNQNNLGALKDSKVRQALAYALDKKSIAAAFPHAKIIDGPILPMFAGYLNDTILKYDFSLDKARELLKEAEFKTETIPAETGENASSSETNLPGAGVWQKKGDEFLTITLTTVDQPDEVQVAELIKKAWENLNIKINLEIVPPQSMPSEIIRPRKYQVLLYGVILGADPDQYPFWHSLQIGPSGLNLSNYSNKEVDALLEDGRITTKEETRKEKYKKLQEIIARDLPAIFLYSQSYLYLQSDKIKGFDTKIITVSSDRFSNVANWYINTRKKIVW